MESRHMKDFTVGLIVIAIIGFCWLDFHLFNENEKVPNDSKYSKLALSEELLVQIQSIENSIEDRKQFVFTVTKDPLEQNLIVKTIVDLEKQWRKEIEAMLRLSATYMDNDGRRFASLAYQGENHLLKVGDSIAGKEIVNISEGKITFLVHGTEIDLALQPIPEKPKELKDPSINKGREYNW